MTHPKIAGLSDKAFRLWVWGLAHAQQHLTDGLITSEVLPQRLKRASEDLVSRRLWEPHDVGFKVHDYLDWNDSREAVIAKRTSAKNRLQRWTDKRVIERVANADLVTPLARSGVGRELPEQEREEIWSRAGRLREELYPGWYRRYRGATLLLVASPLEFDAAVKICRAWTDARIEKLAAVFLTSDDPWISQTDRSFAIFVKKISWCDDKLTQWEKEQAAKAV